MPKDIRQTGSVKINGVTHMQIPAKLRGEGMCKNSSVEDAGASVVIACEADVEVPLGVAWHSGGELQLRGGGEVVEDCRQRAVNGRLRDGQRVHGHLVRQHGGPPAAAHQCKPPRSTRRGRRRQPRGRDAAPLLGEHVERHRVEDTRRRQPEFFLGQPQDRRRDKRAAASNTTGTIRRHKSEGAEVRDDERWRGRSGPGHRQSSDKNSDPRDGHDERTV